jgi:polysaccharide biosynthesis protein PslL
MKTSSPNRLEHVDIAKGIGITIIVFAHNYLASKYNGSTWFALTVSASFNMPLFYLLSGVFFKAAEPFAVALRKKFASIMVPYFATLLFTALFRFCVQDNLSFRFLLYRIKTTLLATGGLIDSSWAALWFLPSLFVTIMAFKIVYDTVLRRLPNKGTELFAVFIILVLGYLLIRSDNHYYQHMRNVYYGLPWSLDIMPIAVFYFALGYYGKSLLTDMYNSDTLNRAAILVSLLLFTALMFYSPAGVDLNRRQYDNLIICTLKALAGIILIIGVAGLLEKSSLSGVKKGFSTAGRLSLFIFLFHGIVQNSAFNYLSGYDILSKQSAAVISFILALTMPIAFYYLVISRVGILQAIYDPARKNVRRNPAHVQQNI